MREKDSWESDKYWKEAKYIKECIRRVYPVQFDTV